MGAEEGMATIHVQCGLPNCACECFPLFFIPISSVHQGPRGSFQAVSEYQTPEMRRDRQWCTTTEYFYYSGTISPFIYAKADLW